MWRPRLEVLHTRPPRSVPIFFHNTEHGVPKSYVGYPWLSYWTRNGCRGLRTGCQNQMVPTR